MRDNCFTIVLGLALLMMTGCHANKENVGAAICYAPLAPPALVAYSLVQGWEVLRDVGADRIYPPAGLTQAQVQEQIDHMPGGKPHKEVAYGYTMETEYWKVRKGHAIIYAKFQDGVSVKYDR